MTSTIWPALPAWVDQVICPLPKFPTTGDLDKDPPTITENITEKKILVDAQNQGCRVCAAGHKASNHGLHPDSVSEHSGGASFDATATGECRYHRFPSSRKRLADCDAVCGGSGNRGSEARGPTPPPDSR